MNKEKIKILKQASKILHKEWDKTKCSENLPPCPQCWANQIIDNLDGLIYFMDESKWKKVNWDKKLGKMSKEEQDYYNNL